MASKKTILLVDNSLYTTGSIKSTLQITAQLRNKYNFIYVLPSASTIFGLVEQNGFEFIRLPMLEVSRSLKILMYFPQLLLNAVRLLRIIRRRKVDVLHINDIYNMLGVIVRILRPDVKVVYCVRLLKTSYIAPAYPTFAFLIKRFSDRIICVSEAVQADIGKPDQSTVIYHNFIPEKLQAWDGLTEPASMKILYLGNYIKGKGQEWAIRAMEIVVKKYSDSQLTFVGSCNNTSDYEIRSSLLKLSKELDLSENISFLGSSIDVELTMKNSDVVLNLSESESFSMVCLEAISFGVPLIASDCGGPSEITDQGKQAFLVPNRDYKEAANAIMQIADDPEGARARALKARIYAREKFNPQKEQASWEKIYR